MSDIIEVDHLHKRYGDTIAVDGVSFSVRRGEIFGMLGPNGAGKSTTIEILQGLRSRSSGRVEVLGLDPGSRPDLLRRRIGSQLQSSALPERLRVGEAVQLFAALRPEEIDVDRALATWDLAPLRRRPFAVLSGGQRQRLFLALALLGDPEVVFLDELTTGLDPVARRATWRLVGAIRDRGATVVLVTHFMEEAEALCDRVAIVDEGRIIATDTPVALTATHTGVRMTFTANGADPRFLSSVHGVQSVTQAGGRVTVRGTGAAPVRVAAALAERGIAPTDYRTHHPTLEDVFLTLTGHAFTEEVTR